MQQLHLRQFAVPPLLQERLPHAAQIVRAARQDFLSVKPALLDDLASEKRSLARVRQALSVPLVPGRPGRSRLSVERRMEGPELRKATFEFPALRLPGGEARAERRGREARRARLALFLPCVRLFLAPFPFGSYRSRMIRFQKRKRAL